jgi:ATP-dependent DNA helicase RecQ
MTGAVTIVVSPLQALIQDQVDSLKRRGIKVAKLDSTVSSDVRFKTILDAIFGNIELLYVTPERFERDELRVILNCGNVGYVILDEVHCLSTWGSTFRPSYKYMARMIASEREKRFLPIYGFSATLPKDVLKDTLSELNVDSIRELPIDFDTDFVSEDIPNFAGNLILRGPAIRPEIKINIIQAKNDSDKLERIIKIIKDLRDLLDKRGEPWIGLVFASFVKSRITHENVEYIAKRIGEGIGEEVIYFHGQMSQAKKRRVISELEKAVKSLSKPRIVVATKAFGMGVDLPNIRFVIHAHVSDSLEDYYQEIGRGGRDRKDCYAIAVYSPDDFDEKGRLIKRISRKTVERLLDIIEDFTKIVGSNEVAIPLKAFYNDFGSGDGRTILKRILQILEDNEIIEYEITNGNLVAYKLLDQVDLNTIKNAIIYHDKLKDVIVLDVNTPRMYVSVLEERIRKLEKEGKIEKVEYTWRVGGKDIKISLNGYKSEIGYISLRKKLRLEEISLLRE